MEGKCAPTRARGNPHTHTHAPAGFWSRIPRGKCSPSLLLECTSARCESTEMSSRWELMKHRDPESLQMAAATEERALKEQREAQARQHKEREAEKL